MRDTEDIEDAAFVVMGLLSTIGVISIVVAWALWLPTTGFPTYAQAALTSVVAFAVAYTISQIIKME